MLFAEPRFLVVALVLPLLLPLYAWVLHARGRRVAAFGQRQLVDGLMPHYSRAKGWWRLSLTVIGAMLLCVALARPMIGAKLTEHKVKGAEVIVCLDVSNSMLAQDYSPNRLERAKLAISRLSDRLRDDRIGLVIFAGTSFVQLPVTTDYISAKMFMGSITTQSIPIQGTAIGDAISLAVRSFSPQSEKSRAIVVITDGENHEDDPVEAARQAAEMGIKVYTIGVGSNQGVPIPMDGGYLKDKDGNMVVTRLDEGTLKEVARAGGGAYIHAGSEEFGLNPVIDDIRRMEDEEFSSVQFEEYTEYYMYFAGAALAFLLAAALVGERKPRRRLFG